MHQITGHQREERLRRMSPEELFTLGASDVVYVKPLEAGGRTVFALHAANGVPVTAVDTREAAVLVARHHHMTLLSVH